MIPIPTLVAIIHTIIVIIAAMLVSISHYGGIYLRYCSSYIHYSRPSPPPIYTVPLVVNPISVYSLIKSWQMVILRFTLNFDDKIFLKENQKLVYDQGRCPYLSAY